MDVDLLLACGLVCDRALDFGRLTAAVAAATAARTRIAAAAASVPSCSQYFFLAVTLAHSFPDAIIIASVVGVMVGVVIFVCCSQEWRLYVLSLMLCFVSIEVSLTICTIFFFSFLTFLLGCNSLAFCLDRDSCSVHQSLQGHLTLNGFRLNRAHCCVHSVCLHWWHCQRFV